MNPHALLARLDAIGHALAQSQHALALIGLGSVGLEHDRLDAHLDLDFFVVVEKEDKSAYLADLQWLTALCPTAYHLPKTSSGAFIRDNKSG